MILTPNTLFLGSGVDADPDGRPGPLANGDDGDYYVDPGTSTFQIVHESPFVVLAPAADGVGGVTAGLPASPNAQAHPLTAPVLEARDLLVVVKDPGEVNGRFGEFRGEFERGRFER